MVRFKSRLKVIQSFYWRIDRQLGVIRKSGKLPQLIFHLSHKRNREISFTLQKFPIKKHNFFFWKRRKKYSNLKLALHLNPNRRENMYTVDINCDMGESFGSYTMARHEDSLECVTSANIACGVHAGDRATMRETVKLALEKNVGIGAHPGLQDLVGFGRREIKITPQEAYDLVIYQIGSLKAFVTAEG